MSHINVPAFVALALALAPAEAQAFNYGFIRVPDWMDRYLVALLVLQLPFWLGLVVTKPRGVPFNQLYRTQMGRVPTFFLRVTQILFVSMMTMFFLGMGLRRAAEQGYSV